MSELNYIFYDLVPLVIIIAVVCKSKGSKKISALLFIAAALLWTVETVIKPWDLVAFVFETLSLVLITVLALMFIDKNSFTHKPKK